MASRWRPLSSTRPHPVLGSILLALAIAIACLPAVLPLLSGDIACGYDNAFHLYRAVQIEHLWRQGVFFSRWAPDMAHGLGFPLFVFGPALSQSLLALVHLLGVPWPMAMNLVFLLGVAIGGAGMFSLARTLYGSCVRVRRRGGRGRHAGPMAQDEGEPLASLALACGAVATVAYVYAPFFAYDIYNRGSLWGAFGWAFPPWVLLGLLRWSLDRDRRYLVLGVAAFSAMVLTHQLFAFLFAPVFALWAVLQAVERRSWAVLGRGALLGAVALGLTAFFWVPATLERSFIQPDRYLGTWVFDFHHNFLPLSHLLALPRVADPALSNDWPQKALGLVPVIVALLPAIAWRRFTRPMRRRMLLLWGLLLAFAVLTQPLTLPLWEWVPLLSFLQFPWRYLAPATFLLALLAGGAPVALVGRRDIARDLGWRTAGLVAALACANLGWLYPTTCDVPGDLTVAGMIAWERATDTVGTTATSEYLPVWVERFPDVRLDAHYGAGEQVVRLPLESLPPGTSSCDATYGPLRSDIRLMTSEPFTARYLAFYYPGWRVTVDGVRVPVAPEPETGLLTFDVPAGQHHIEVAFTETPLRAGADTVSLLALLGFAVWLTVNAHSSATLAGDSSSRLRDKTVSPPIPSVASPLPVDNNPRFPGRDDRPAAARLRLALALAITGLALLAVRTPIADGFGLLWRHSRWDGADDIAGAALPFAASFGQQARLLAAEALPQDVAYDGQSVLTLYWRALQPTAADWRVGLTLVGLDGSRWPVGTRPARWGREPGRPSTWPRDGYARMDLLLGVTPGMPPGDYVLELAYFDRDTAAPASVLDDQGNPRGPALALGGVRVAVPDTPPALGAFDVPEGAELQACGAVGVWNAGLNRDVAKPGDLVELSAVWESLTSARRDLVLEVVLRDGEGTEATSWELAPVASWWPTSRWVPGQRWQGTHSLRLPGGLDMGVHTVSLSVDDCDLGLWELGIEAPDRVWVLPPDFATTEAVLGQRIALAGYSGLPASVSPGETVDLALAWQALAEITLPYRVFVHAVDPAANLIAQNDGEPLGWTRPTSGWAVGEVIVDPRPLAIPADADGPLVIRVGLYGPDGTRLRLPDGTDAILLGELAVID